MEVATWLLQSSILIYVTCLVTGLIIFFDLLNKAFIHGFIPGLLCVLFPIGTYFYCKQNWQTTKLHAIGITVCTIAGIAGKAIEMLSR